MSGSADSRSLRLRSLLVAAAVTALAVTLGACGGASDEEIAQAEKNGEARAKQELRLRVLENKLDRGIKGLKRQGGSTAQKGSELHPPASSGSSGSSPSKDCGNGLSANSMTSCAFSENVRFDYERSIAPGAGNVESFSPETGKQYVMYCTAGTPHECTGGVGAAVYFP